MGRRPIEDVVDEALQSLLDGEPAEAILARYAGYEAELTPLLFAATTLKDAPPPRLSQASIAAMVDRAEAQAGRSRRVPAPVILPPALSTTQSSEEINSVGRTERAAKVSTQTKQSEPTWQERVTAWLSPATSLLRLPTAVAAIAVVVIALVTMVRLLDRPQQIYPPVPTATAQFTLDGKIQQVDTGMWTVDREVIYLDSRTVISGTPQIGSQTHIEGDIASDNRRIARTIEVSSPPPGTTTPIAEVIASATTRPTPFTLTVDTTSTPISAPVSTIAPTYMLPETSTAIPAITGEAEATIQPRSTAGATGVTEPTAVRPTRTVPALPTQPTAVPTRAVWTASPQPTAGRQPSPLPTSTLRPSPTLRPDPPTPTALPQSEPTVTAEVEASRTPEPTLEPEHTPQPLATPTGHAEPTATAEPEETSTTRPTTVPQPTTTSIPTTEPEETATAEPTTVHANTPTTQPTIPPAVSPTRTEEPHETQTAEPTHGPETTRTAQPTRTSEPSRTPEPTHTEDTGGK